MATLPFKKSVAFEDGFSIKTIPLGTVSQGGKEWPIRGAIVEVTPAVAARFLKCIGRVQRRIKTHHLASLTRDMTAGKFVFTGEPIIFSSADQMVDGQHRCTVCVQTDRGFTCLVIFGIPEESYRAINVTAKRTGADTLRMDGCKNDIALAATASWVFRWECEDLLSNLVLSPTEVSDVVFKNPNLADSVEKTMGLRAFGVGHALPAFCHWLFTRIDPDSADDFFTRFSTDVGHEDKSPILALRRKLLNPGAGGKTLTRRQAVICFFKAWNLYRGEKGCKLITATVDEAIPQLI